jgi:exopolysaccharide biosynthesis polyprenyl glycosylphosphotransferase
LTSVAGKRARPRRVLFTLDVFSACVCVVALELLLQVREPDARATRLGYFVGLLLTVLLTVLLVFRDGQYSQSRRMSRLADIGGLVKNLVLAGAASVLLGFLTKGFFTGLSSPSRLVTLGSVLVFAVLTATSRLVLSAYQRRQFARGVGLRRLLVLGTGKAADDFVDFLARRPWLGVSCVGRLAYSSLPVTETGEPLARSVEAVCITNTMQGLEDLDRVLRVSGAGEVVVALDVEEHGLIPHVTKLLSLAHIRYSLVPSLFEPSFRPVALNGFAELPVVEVTVDPLDRVQRMFKRVFDVVVAVAGIVVVLPLGLLINAAIVLDSGRPTIYAQERVGRNGRRFEMYKFRTMVKDADKLLASLADQNEAGTDLLFKMRDDPRVTKVGKILRRLSLDELPQLWNVLRGDMSLVGPRPPLPDEVTRYEEQHFCRLRSLPGMTGLWQVSGRSDLSFDEMVKLDRYYQENWSLRMDLAIVAKTFAVILGRRGAY